MKSCWGPCDAVPMRLTLELQSGGDDDGMARTPRRSRSPLRRTRWWPHELPVPPMPPRQQPQVLPPPPVLLIPTPPSVPVRLSPGPGFIPQRKPETKKMPKPRVKKMPKPKVKKMPRPKDKSDKVEAPKVKKMPRPKDEADKMDMADMANEPKHVPEAAAAAGAAAAPKKKRKRTVNGSVGKVLAARAVAMCHEGDGDGDDKWSVLSGKASPSARRRRERHDRTFASEPSS